jgi:tetratricopeptide (TPR) repeat protein
MASSYTSKPIQIFISFAPSVRKDKKMFDELKKHLNVLKQQGSIEGWYDSEIDTGSDWRKQIDTYIKSADIIVLLLSVDFFASERCREIEFKQAVERCKARVARLLSVILRPFNVNGLIPNESDLLPSNGIAVAQWSDRDVAWEEIARSIRKVVEELRQQLAKAGSRPVRPHISQWNVPYRRNPLFMGREDMLDELHHYFVAYQTSIHILAIHGMNGIGKTQLAIEYAYRYQNDYHMIYWIRASSRELFITDVIAFAQQLSILVEKDLTNEQYLFTAVKRWLQSHKKWLLLLDGLEDFGLLEALIPPQCNGHVLLTTLIRATGPHVHAIPLMPLTVETGTLFLLRRAKILVGQTSPENLPPQVYQQATLIAQEVGGHPLALDQAGAYIEETQRNISAYLSLYQERRALLLQRRGHFSNEHSESVATALSLVFEKVAHRNAYAMDLLRFLAFCQPDAIPDNMLGIDIDAPNKSLQILASDPWALDEALETLLYFSLIHRQANSTVLSMHPIVQAILQDKCTPEQRCQWAIYIVRLVSHLFPEAIYSEWSACEHHFLQAQQCARYITAWQIALPEAAILLSRLGRYCYERAQYAEAEVHLTAALHLYEQIWGPEHIDTAKTLNALALLFDKQGDTHRAELYQQRALALYEQIFGSDHIETAAMLNDLGLLYRDRADNTQAESLLQRALSIRERALHHDHPALAQSLDNLGLLYRNQGKLQQAEPLLQRALSISEQVYGTEHPNLSTVLNNLASLRHAQGRYQEAEQLYQRAFAIDVHALGPDHPETVVGLNNLAYLYRVQNRHEQAEPLYQRALSVCELTLGELHPDTALVLYNLGLLYVAQQDYARAEPFLQRAVAIYGQMPGAEPADTVSSLQALADLYIRRNKLQQAEQLLQHALDICMQKFGPGREATMLIVDLYAYLLEQMQKKEEARTLRDTIHSTQEHSASPSSEENT